MDASLKNGTELSGVDKKISASGVVLALPLLLGGSFSSVQVCSDEIAWR